jgi:hypothetical protein
MDGVERIEPTSILLVKRFSFLLIADFSMTVLDLISSVVYTYISYHLLSCYTNS